MINKFKIWDGEKMLYSGEISLQNDSGGWPYVRINLHNYFKPHCRDFKVLQWAGIKDSKGKDIYVAAQDIPKPFFNFMTNNGDLLIEVIGNIYEHPTFFKT